MADNTGLQAVPDATSRLGSNVINDHGVIGNMETTAFVSTAGTIDFMCYPRIDSPTVFAALLDEQRGGAFSIHPNLDSPRLVQMYIPDTNVLITRFMAADAICEIVDFMPVYDEGAPAVNCVIRLVRCVYGALNVNMRCAPRFDYARSPHELRRHGNNSLDFVSAQASLALHATVELAIDAGDACARFDLQQGESACFIVGPPQVLDQALPCQTLLDETVAYWRKWSAHTNYCGRYREMVMRSALVLKMLSSREFGAIVAAPTFGLPETPAGGRRWDYRYTWIRDSAFSVYALLRLGYTSEAGDFMRWIARRSKGCEPDGSINVMYSVDGRESPEEMVIATLYGEGVDPPLIGNAARDQQQLDVYGALLDAVYLYNKYGETISYDEWNDITRTVDYVVDHWRDADHGIWEFRNGERPLLHSRLMCWVAVDRAVRLARKRSLSAPYGKWFAARDAIHEDIFANFWNDELKSFVQTPGSATLDASILMMPLVRFIGPKDERWLSTLAAIGRELRIDALIYRYTRGGDIDGLEGEEGSFTACSFWYVEALARAGKVDEAWLLFEKLLTFANHLGLYTEEISIAGESLGNFPQALTHLALISAAFQLDRSLSGARTPWS